MEVLRTYGDEAELARRYTQLPTFFRLDMQRITLDARSGNIPRERALSKTCIQAAIVAEWPDVFRKLSIPQL
jgi:hypothetical protein